MPKFQHYLRLLLSDQLELAFQQMLCEKVGLIYIDNYKLKKQGQIYTREDMENTNLISGGQLENPRCVLSDGPDDSVFEDPIYDDPPVYRR